MIGRSGSLAWVGLVAALSGCNGASGSVESIVAPPPEFGIASRAPSPGREGVPLTNAVVVTFTDVIDPASVTPGAISANGKTSGTLQVDGATLKFTPAGGWVPGTAYAIALNPELRGTSGIRLGPVPVWGFKTAGEPPVPDTVLAVRARPR